MNDITAAIYPPGMSARMNVPAIGPVESRRARRERAGAAHVAAAQDNANPGMDHASFEEPMVTDAAVFADVFATAVTDELAVARERKFSEAAAHTAMSHDDVGN